MSAPLLLVPLVTLLASLLLVSQPAQPLSIIKKVFESKSFYLVFIADGHRLELLTINRQSCKAPTRAFTFRHY